MHTVQKTPACHRHTPPSRLRPLQKLAAEQAARSCACINQSVVSARYLFEDRGAEGGCLPLHLECFGGFALTLLPSRCTWYLSTLLFRPSACELSPHACPARQKHVSRQRSITWKRRGKLRTDTPARSLFTDLSCSLRGAAKARFCWEPFPAPCRAHTHTHLATLPAASEP